MEVTQDRGRSLGSSPSSGTNLMGDCHLSDPRTLSLQMGTVKCSASDGGRAYTVNSYKRSKVAVI